MQLPNLRSIYRQISIKINHCPLLHMCNCINRLIFINFDQELFEYFIQSNRRHNEALCIFDCRGYFFSH